MPAEIRTLWQYLTVDWTKTKKLVRDEFLTIDFASCAKGVEDRAGQVARFLPWPLLTRSFLAALRLSERDLCRCRGHLKKGKFTYAKAWRSRFWGFGGV
jgi:hypothetical protein